MINRIKQGFTFQHSFIRAIPNSLHLATLLSILMVSGATVYSIEKINQLEESTNSLLLIAIPLKESTHSLKTHMEQAKFFLHKFIALEDSAYYSATLNEMIQLMTVANNLNDLLRDLPEIQVTMKTLQADLLNYQQYINELESNTGRGVPQAIENIIEKGINDFNIRINILAKNRARTAIIAAEHVTDILLLLVIGILVSGMGFSILYAVVAMQPMKKLRRALKRIGDGFYDKQLSLEGPQEIQDLSRDVNNMQTKLRKLESAKMEFQSLISHELKTPLASFKSGIDLLIAERTGVLSPNQRRVVAILQKQSLQLESTIQEMLDMQSIQTQRLVMDIRPGCLTEVVDDAIEQILPLTGKKNQSIKKIGLSDSVQAFIDPGRTRQIVLNLLSNANKYSPDNSQITVTIKSHTEYAEIIIEDEGPGIPDIFLDKVCERFFQVPTAGAHLRGTGLGLAIAREISEIQNGVISIKNLKIGGVCVRVLLPLYDLDYTDLRHQNSTP